MTGPSLDPLWPRSLRPVSIALVAALALPATPAAALDPICFNQGATACGVFSHAPRDSVRCPSGTTFVWDWATGYVSMDGAGGLNGCDTLTILGLPAGEPVPLRVSLHGIADFDAITSGSTTGFTYDLWFYDVHTGLSLDGIVNPGDPPVHFDVVREMPVPLPCVAGTPFRLNIQFGGAGQAGHVGRFRALIEFLDLPEGATIVSRKGRTDPTPTRAPTWGAIKTLWR